MLSNNIGEPNYPQKCYIRIMKIQCLWCSQGNSKFVQLQDIVIKGPNQVTEDITGKNSTLRMFVLLSINSSLFTFYKSTVDRNKTEGTEWISKGSYDIQFLKLPPFPCCPTVISIKVLQKCGMFPCTSVAIHTSFLII